MAKKSSRSGSKKHYPVQRKFLVSEDSPTSNNQNMIVQTDRALSQVNHRLYRQSRVYKVKVSLHGTGEAAALPSGLGVDVYAISDTWMNQNAYQEAYDQFVENSREEKEQLGKSAARWNDFRVAHGFSAAFMMPFLSEGAGPSILTTGEYEVSEVTDAAGNANTFRWIGTGAQTFNIIDEYDNMGNTDATPSTPQTGVAYDGLTDELDDNQMVHMSNDGNNPPYAAATLENGVFSRVGRLFIGANGDGKLTTGYFNAPCGLIFLRGVGGGTSTNLTEIIQIEVQGGDYKGVHGAPYLEV